MVLNCSPDLIEITIFNVLTIGIQRKQAMWSYLSMDCYYFNSLGRGSVTEGPFVPNYFKIGLCVFTRRFFKSSLNIHTSNTHLWSYLSLEPYNFNILGRGLPKEHLWRFF